MPWEDDRGGRRTRSGGPWGQPSGGGGGGGGGPRRPNGGNNTPNLEDILARGRQQFGGGSGIPGGGRWIAALVVVVAIVFWASQSFYQLGDDQVGVEILFGEPKEEFSYAGLNFILWPVEQVEVVTTTQFRTRIGSTTDRDSEEGLMLSGDQNLVNMSFSVLWRISNPREYIFEVDRPDELVRQAAESAMREVVGRRTAQEVFRDDRSGIELEVAEITQDILDRYGAGVQVVRISLENTAPPAEVADAFDEVQRALQDEDRFQEQARGYANTALGEARGNAAAIREQAAGYRDQVINEATGEAARFVAIYNEYRNAPEVTRQRMYLEAIESILAGSEKIILGAGEGSDVVPYLPLPALQGNSGNQSTGGNQ